MYNRSTFFYNEKDSGFLEFALKSMQELNNQYTAELEEYYDHIMYRGEASLRWVAPEVHSGYKDLEKQCAQYQERIKTLQKIINKQPITKEAQQQLLELEAFRGTVVARYENVIKHKDDGKQLGRDHAGRHCAVL